MTVSINGTNGLTFADSSTQNTAATGFGFKNRIINGACMIDQRNAGAAVTTSGAYPVDRTFAFNVTDGAFSAQQDSTAPTGFINSLKWTTTTADSSLAADQRCGISQKIEGTNCSDLAWGTVNAATVTLSFWVRSSLTGTFGGVIRNSAVDRAYPFSYTISSANTWEQKAVTIPGDTTGTWLTTTGTGIQVMWGLGAGTTYSATAGAWTSGNIVSATGATSVIGTLGATFYITGVQLEKGSTATSFDYRPYGTELALCQRYYWKMTGAGTGTPFCNIGCESTTKAYGGLPYPVPMRSAPTMSTSGTAGDYAVRVWNGASVNCSSVPAAVSPSIFSTLVDCTGASGMTAGYPGVLRDNNANAYLGFSAEL